MLKWTNAAQSSMVSNRLRSATTPTISQPRKSRRKAPATNEENVPERTSTPLGPRHRNSPVVIKPLNDVLNITPISGGDENSSIPRRRRSVTTQRLNRLPITRRHSVGFIATDYGTYASTLPRFEEEYSPNTNVLPSGQELALRGVWLDTFLGKQRYLSSPNNSKEQLEYKSLTSLPKKRNLEAELLQIAKDDDQSVDINSAKMDDETLDKLIDAILDSARKDEKKKKPRKSFNLRRRTLLKTHSEVNEDLASLSPSYTAGDDPASDLSVLSMKGNSPHPISSSVKKNSFMLNTPIRCPHKRLLTASQNCEDNKRLRSDSEIGVALPSLFI